MQKVCEIVWKLAEPVVQEIGAVIWDVEFVKEGGQQYLRVFLDREGGATIDDCERVSRALDPILDERDPVGCSYIFEVSSAGLERQLKRQSDFETYMGQQVVLRTFAPRDGTKEFSGTLKGYENGAVTLEINDVPTRFEKKEVAVVHLKIQI